RFAVAETAAAGDAWQVKTGEVYMRIGHSATVALLLGSSAAFALPTKEIQTSEAAYIAKVKTGAPEQIIAKATIVIMKDGKETTLQKGSNGYTCLIDNSGTPLCADENAMEWRNAVAAKAT